MTFAPGTFTLLDSVPINITGGVMADEELLIKIAGRCTGSAWEALKAIEGTPEYGRILEILARKPGTILECDVGKARNEVENSDASAQLSRPTSITGAYRLH